MQPKKVTIVAADGTITKEIRQKLKAKRLELGASAKRVATELGLHQATVTKWETGSIQQCQIGSRRKLEDFLQGKYDALFLAPRRRHQPLAEYVGALAEEGVKSAGALVNRPVNLETQLQRVTITYNLCRNKADLQQEMMQRLEMLTDNILAKLNSEG